MNSINKDADYQDNTEANNFVFIDRFMQDVATWQKDLSQVQKMSNHLRFEDKADKLWFRGAPTSDNNTIFGNSIQERVYAYNAFGQYQEDRPASFLENIMSEKTDDFHQSMWPRMHLLVEAQKHPDDIDAKLSQDVSMTFDANKRIELREFAQADWKKNIATDPNLFNLLQNAVDERVNDGEYHNYPTGTVKELLRNINRYYIDPKTNKIIDKNLDRNKYSISGSDRPDFSF